MNELVTAAPTLPPAERQAGLSIAKTLQASEKSLAILNSPLPRGAFSALMGCYTPDKARAALMLLPPRNELSQRVVDLRQSASEPANRAAARAMIGMLLDAYPTGRPANLAGYAETMLHDIVDLDFPPAIVATACRTLRRTLKFLPSVAEVVEACKAAEAEWKSALNNAELTLERRDDAERRAAAPIAPPPARPDHHQQFDGV